MFLKGVKVMPPKFKFTKEQVISAALDITREQGAQALTARSLAARLGSSPKPIFGLFDNMNEVEREVIAAAKVLYQSYLEREMSSGKYPPYKASGMGYIRFAKQEKELFKLLFMRDRTQESIENGRDELKPILGIIMQNLGVDENTAFEFHIQQWIYVHGIATMLATSYLELDEEFIQKALTDIYLGLKWRYTEEK